MKFYTSNQLATYINHHINEVDIFSKYMDIPTTEIYKCINNKNYRIHNTLRDDQNPSFGFQYLNVGNKIKLYGKDFANPFYTGDKYHIVGIALNLNSNNSRDFVNICKDIIKTFKNNTSPAAISNKPVKTRIKTTFRIDVIKREWTISDLKYWGSMGYTFDTLVKEKIHPISSFSLDNNPNDYYYDVDDPAYAYYLGRSKYDLWEIYRPFANKYNKFRTNNISDIKEMYSIKPNNNLILTKSKKDKALIVQILRDLDIDDTDVLYTSESNRLKSSTRNTIERNYRDIYVNFDIDMPGINGMRYFSYTYGYKVFPFTVEDLITDDKMPKDISDFAKRFGYDNTVKLFNHLYKTQINEEI